MQAILKGAVKVLANKGYEGETIKKTGASELIGRSCIIILKTMRILSQKPYLVVLLNWCNHILQD